MSDEPDEEYQASDDVMMRAFGELLPPGAVVTGYVVMATWMDAEDDSRIFGMAPPGQLSTTTLGMAGWIDERERHLIRERLYEDDD